MSVPPVLKGKQSYYPTKPVCPWCKTGKVFEPHSMAIFRGGALSRLGLGSYGGPTKGLRAYLSFCWHGAHDDGEGDHRDNDITVDIARDVEGGLFDVMFCSVACLRGFLNARLDHFEQQVNELRPLAMGGRTKPSRRRRTKTRRA